MGVLDFSFFTWDVFRGYVLGGLYLDRKSVV